MLSKLLQSWLCRMAGCRHVTVRWKFGKVVDAVPSKKPSRTHIIQSKRKRYYDVSFQIPYGSQFPGYYDVSFQIPYGSQFPVSVDFKDNKGNPAKVDGAPAWATDNPAILTLEPAADGLSCVVKSTGVVGTATVQMTADADLGAGTKALLGTLEVEVTAREATSVALTPGEVTDIPDPAPTA